ncbi:MAG: FIST C-terminal domain-containing protein [Planctomycetota bacterium]|jgi:small ligand-binding sensory domain FIST|nr:FIST C-terminal domain-containing protein [Planctomycetota bacterium]
MKFSSAHSTTPSSEEALREVLNRIQEDFESTDPPDVAIFFITHHHQPCFPELGLRVKRSLNVQHLLGTTAESVIEGTQEFENQPVLALWAGWLPEVQIHPFRITCAQTDEGFSFTGIPQELPSGSTSPPTFLLLPDPFTIPTQEMLKIFSQQFPGAVVTGGLASGGQAPGQNTLFLNGDTFQEGAIGIAIQGPIEIRTIISQGCRPIGRHWVVTQAKGNILNGLGGKPPLERLQEIFETLDPEELELVRSALHIGLVTNEYQEDFDRGDFLIRNVIGVDPGDGSLLLSDLVRTGQTVQFQVREPDSAREDLLHLLNRDRSQWKTPPLGGLIFSCNGRGSRLFGDPNVDISGVRSVTGNIPIAGFFAQGEIGPVGGENFIHGFTASVALFAPASS